MFSMIILPNKLPSFLIKVFFNQSYQLCMIIILYLIGPCIVIINIIVGILAIGLV